MNDTKEWDTQLLREFFHPEDIPLILGLKLSHSFATDGYVWNHTKSGVYTVKYGYDLLQLTKLGLLQTEVREQSITRLLSHVWKPTNVFGSSTNIMEPPLQRQCFILANPGPCWRGLCGSLLIWITPPPPGLHQAQPRPIFGRWRNRSRRRSGRSPQAARGRTARRARPPPAAPPRPG